ncbi:MAG TPA: metallopeptidase TldD-related protein [Bacillota bacterium]|nr:metallopeptidase TldD-related protein [Bacillota bacterium]
MDLARTLAANLQELQLHKPDLEAWRFDLHETKGVELGLKNNRLGGPYSAPSYKRSVSGELYLIWKGNRYTSAKLDSQVISAFNEYTDLWQTTAYCDEDGVGLYKPEKIPTLELADPQAKQIVHHDFQVPYQLLEDGLKKLTGYGAAKVDGKVRCFETHRSIVNSADLVVEYAQTPCEFFFEINDSYGEVYHEKKWPAPFQIDRIINNTGQIGVQLSQTPVSANLSGPILLIFPPSMFEAFLSYYLISNLYGGLVINRQSRFSLADFQNRRPVLREDLNLEVNVLLPYRSFSYPCTSEAAPGGSLTFIAGGRLQTPILNLKYAKKAGLNPTPIPNGGKGFFLKSASSAGTWEQLISETENALIVYSILGLHTQDSSSGVFSLTADQCLLVKNGKVQGKTKAVINGDFLGSLCQSASKFGFMEGEDNPGYAFWANCAIC